MYFAARAKLGYPFDQTMYNSHCSFVPWHLPSKVDYSTKLVTGEYHIDRPEVEEWLQRWKWDVLDSHGSMP
jgi:cryptochrome